MAMVANCHGVRVSRVLTWEPESAVFGLGVPELIVILVVALLIFGPGRLPEIGSALGRSIRDFRKAFEGGEPKIEDQQDKDGKSAS
jgi:sec-independent protein translocase protein TatA